MSTAKTQMLGLLGALLVPGLTQAQSVIVRHVVQAEAVPLASVRDSGWVKTVSDSDSHWWTWTGELRANITSELQVRGPDVGDLEAHVRVGSGPWVRLYAGVWNAISVLGAGRRHIAIEYSAAPGSASQGPPDVRIR